MFGSDEEPVGVKLDRALPAGVQLKVVFETEENFFLPGQMTTSPQDAFNSIWLMTARKSPSTHTMAEVKPILNGSGKPDGKMKSSQIRADCPTDKLCS